MTAAQADAVVLLLAEIRDLLRPGDEPPEFDDDGRCLHPDELKLKFSNNEWICRRCKHHEG